MKTNKLTMNLKRVRKSVRSDVNTGKPESLGMALKLLTIVKAYDPGTP